MSLVWPEPSAFMTYISALALPSRQEVKAILKPSGDQEGYPSRAGSLVSLVWPEPSALITYISELPSRSETKAILEP